MNRILLILFLGLVSGTAVSQPKVTVGKPYEVIDAGSKDYYYENGEILTVKIQDKTLLLQKMNASSLAFLQVRSYDDFPSKFQIESLLNLGNRYYLFYSLYQDEQEQLFVREIDFRAGTFKSGSKKILTLNEKISGTLTRSGGWVGRYATGDKFDFFSSYDASTLVIQYRMKPEIRSDAKNFDRIGMHVVDRDLNEKWSDIITMPYTEKKMDNLDYSVDAAGNVYMIARVYNDNTTDDKKRGDDKANYKLEILKVTATAGRRITATKVDVADKFVNKIWVYESPRHDMYCAGFYSNGKTDNGTDGIILFKIDKTDKLYDMRTYEIPVSILNQYASKKEQRKNSRKEEDGEAQASFLNLREVIIHDDGSMLVVGEESYEQTYYYSSGNGRSSSRTVYYYEDILATKIDPSGKLAWMKKLPKRQQGGRGRGGMSYRYFDAGSEHYFLFLDHEKNMNLPVNKEPATHTDGAGGFLTAYTVNDQSGEVQKISVLDTRDVNGIEIFQFAPTRMLATEANTLVFEAYKKKKEDIMVKIVFK